MKRLLFCVLVAFFSVQQALAQVELKPGYPEEYLVREGDTLWDIANSYLQDPWLWPEIWYVNPQVSNPHLIFPGDVLGLVYVEGRPRLQVNRRGQASRTVKLSPGVRIEPIDLAIPAIPLDTINNFLSNSRILDLDELEAAPYIIAGGERRLITGAGDVSYARGEEFPDDIPVYSVLRNGGPYVDPETNEILGYQAQDIGSVRVTDVQGQVATLSVTRTTQEIRIKDRLLPDEERTVTSVFYPSTPSDPNIEGQIVAVESGVTQVGNLNVVILNRGEVNGLEIGNVMAIFKRGEIVRDPVADENVILPDTRAGVLMVFRTFERMSLALVLEATRPLAINDKVRRP